MLFALLAAYLTKKPPWVQAIIVGLCCGLFVTAAWEADDRTPELDSTVLIVVIVAALTGALFFLGLRAQHVSAAAQAELPRWVSLVYVAVWLLSIVAALLALFGNGGFKVATLAIVPIVLLAPPAITGMKTMAGRTSQRSA